MKKIITAILCIAFTAILCSCGFNGQCSFADPGVTSSVAESSVIPETSFPAAVTTESVPETTQSVPEDTTEAPHVCSFGEWLISVSADCTNDGTEIRECGCGAKETRNIPAAGHTEAVDIATAPDCVNSGLTEGKHCSVCGIVIISRNTIPATGHTYKDGICTDCGFAEIDDVNHTHSYGEWKTDADATCTENGSQTRACSCRKTETEVLPALGHTEAFVAGKDATCTESGLTEGKICSVCNTVIIEQETVPAVGHQMTVVNKKSATCTSPGYTGDGICDVCRETVSVGSELPMLSHKEVTVPGKAATCSASGTTDGKKCSVCGKVTVAQKTLSKLAHKETVVAGKPATCAKTGLTEGKKCSVCGKVTVEQKTVSKLAHSETVVPGKSPTCTENGLTDGKKCSVCGTVTVRQKSIKPTGHLNTEVVGYVAATTISFGFSGDTYCKDCGEFLYGGYIIPMLPSEIGIFRESIKLFHWDEESIYRDIEAEIVRLTNIEREKAGLEPLIWVEDGYCFAKIRADESRDFFSHTRPDGKSFDTAFTDYGIKVVYGGENLYKVSAGGPIVIDISWAQRFVDGWMNSPGHKANILKEDFAYICVAISNENGTVTAVQNFFGDTHPH